MMVISELSRLRYLPANRCSGVLIVASALGF
jgi:hypothetical protein